MRELKEELEEKIKQYNELEGDYKNLENERYLKVSVVLFRKISYVQIVGLCMTYIPWNSITVFHLR